MKYEIITGDDNLLVLTVNSRVILVSHDLTEVFSKIEDTFAFYARKFKKDWTNTPITEKEETKEIEIVDKEPFSGSLEKLFEF